jgi:hypothetical protein
VEWIQVAHDSAGCWVLVNVIALKIKAARNYEMSGTVCQSKRRHSQKIGIFIELLLQGSTKYGEFIIQLATISFSK